MLKNKFFRQIKASASVEASIVFFVIVTIMAIVLNALISFSYKSKLEHLSYTLASLARESALIESDFNEEYAEKLFSVALKYSKNYIPNADDLAFSITFIDNDNNLNYSKGECEVTLDEHEALKDYSLVMVGVCAKPSIQNILGLFNNEIIAKSVVVKR